MIRKIDELISELNSENIDEIKPLIQRVVNLKMLGIDNEKISDERLKEIKELIQEMEEFDEEDEEFFLLEKFKEIYREFFYNLIQKDKNIEKVIGITKTALGSIGGRGRIFMIFENSKTISYLKSKECAEDLLRELFSRMEQVLKEKTMGELFLITGLVNTIKFHLNESLVEYSKGMISILKHEKEKEVQRIMNDYNFNREKIIEMERAIYLWDKLTVDLRSHFVINEMYS